MSVVFFRLFCRTNFHRLWLLWLDLCIACPNSRSILYAHQLMILMVDVQCTHSQYTRPNIFAFTSTMLLFCIWWLCSAYDGRKIHYTKLWPFVHCDCTSTGPTEITKKKLRQILSWKIKLRKTKTKTKVTQTKWTLTIRRFVYIQIRNNFYPAIIIIIIKTEEERTKNRQFLVLCFVFITVC